MESKLQVVIIGAGQMGLSHAQAYKKHPAFKIAGFVDTDVVAAKKAASIFGGTYAKILSGLIISEKANSPRGVKGELTLSEIVVSVCVSDQAHYGILKEIEALKIKYGILEKPLTTKLNDSKKILASRFFKRGKFLVNYTRRFVPEFWQLQKNIKTGKYGKFLGGSGAYGKGFLHNGSHFVDLLRYLVGDIKKVTKLSALHDFKKEDPTYSVNLELKKGGTVLLQGVDSRRVRVFEMDLFFEKGRVRITDSGRVIEEYGVKNDKFMLSKTTKTSKDKAMDFAVDNLHQAIAHKKPLLCTIEDAYIAQKICSQ